MSWAPRQLKGDRQDCTERGSSQECGCEQAQTGAAGDAAPGTGATGRVGISLPRGAAPACGGCDVQAGQQTLRDRATARGGSSHASLPSGSDSCAVFQIPPGVLVHCRPIPSALPLTSQALAPCCGPPPPAHPHPCLRGPWLPCDGAKCPSWNSSSLPLPSPGHKPASCSVPSPGLSYTPHSAAQPRPYLPGSPDLSCSSRPRRRVRGAQGPSGRAQGELPCAGGVNSPSAQCTLSPRHRPEAVGV